MDYATLSLAEVQTGLADVARDVEHAFGALNARQLNWRPDAARWSVGQCLEHLLTTNRLMFSRADDALNPAHPRTVWQRLPGRCIIKVRLHLFLCLMTLTVLKTQPPGKSGISFFRKEF